MSFLYITSGLSETTLGTSFIMTNPNDCPSTF